MLCRYATGSACLNTLVLNISWGRRFSREFSAHGLQESCWRRSRAGGLGHHWWFQHINNSYSEVETWWNQYLIHKLYMYHIYIYIIMYIYMCIYICVYILQYVDNQIYIIQMCLCLYLDFFRGHNLQLKGMEPFQPKRPCDISDFVHARLQEKQPSEARLRAAGSATAGGCKFPWDDGKI